MKLRSNIILGVSNVAQTLLILASNNSSVPEKTQAPPELDELKKLPASRNKRKQRRRR